MAFDIYGQRLERGHCEVHPWVHCSYPCPVCINNNKNRNQQRKAEEEIRCKMEKEYYEDLKKQMVEELANQGGGGVCTSVQDAVEKFFNGKRPVMSAKKKRIFVLLIRKK